MSVSMDNGTEYICDLFCCKCVSMCETRETLTFFKFSAAAAMTFPYARELNFEAILSPSSPLPPKFMVTVLTYVLSYAVLCSTRHAHSPSLY